MKSLPSIRPGLLHHPLDGQVLVYDSGADRVHLLDPTTASVMELLQEGGRDLDAIATETSRRIGVASDTSIVKLALEELRQADLLESSNIEWHAEEGFSRRDAVRKLAAAGIAGVLVPTIATLTASRAYAQGTLAGVGSACSTNAQCQSNRCCGGSCRTVACTASGGNNNCGPGVNPPNTNGAQVPDCTCCSGICARNGNSANINCT